MARILRSQGFPTPPGVASTVCIQDFETQKRRPGAVFDHTYLTSTFKVMGFKTFPNKARWSLIEFGQHLDEVVTAFDEDPYKDGPYFLCLSTHGNGKAISFSDGCMTINGLRRILGECTRLRRRAKVILVQACQGKMTMEEGGPRAFPSFTSDSAVDPWGNTMVFSSCLPTRVSYSCDIGSIFITHFCYALVSELIRKNGSTTINDVKNRTTKAMSHLTKINNREVFLTPETTENFGGRDLTLTLVHPEDAEKLLRGLEIVMKKMKLKTENFELDEHAPGGSSSRSPVSTTPTTTTRRRPPGRPLKGSLESKSLQEETQTPSRTSSPSPKTSLTSYKTPPSSSTTPTAPCNCKKSSCKTLRCTCRKNNRACSKQCHAGDHLSASCSIPPCGARGRGCSKCTSCNCKREGVNCSRDCHPNRSCQNEPTSRNMYILGVAFMVVFILCALIAMHAFQKSWSR